MDISSVDVTYMALALFSVTIAYQYLPYYYNLFFLATFCQVLPVWKIRKVFETFFGSKLSFLEELLLALYIQII